MSITEDFSRIDFSGFNATLKNTLTEVDLIWIGERQEHWIRFGQYADDRIIDRKRRTLSFKPNSIFAFVRWASNDYGTTSSRIDILRTVARGEAYTTLNGVRPGGEILLHLHGWPKVRAVLRAIDEVEALDIDPCDVAPDHWCHMHNRLTVDQLPRRYTLASHHVWLARREVQS